MFICEIWLFDRYFPQFCKSDMSKYGHLEVFQRVPLIRDNEGRLYMIASLSTKSFMSTYLVFKTDIVQRFTSSDEVVFVVCFWFNGLLRQYFSLYRAATQREGEGRERKDSRDKKMSKQPPPAPTASTVSPCPTKIQIVGRPNTDS